MTPSPRIDVALDAADLKLLLTALAWQVGHVPEVDDAGAQLDHIGRLSHRLRLALDAVLARSQASR